MLVGFSFVAGSCVTTYSDGRSESTTDDIATSIRRWFHFSSEDAWQLHEFEPFRFLKPDSSPLLIAPSPDMPGTDNLIVVANVPEPLDQGQMPVGPVFSAGYVATSVYFSNRFSSYRCSPVYLFQMLNGSASMAIETGHTLKFLESSGCARMSLLPYRTIADYQRRPDSLAVRDARRFRITGFGRVDLSDKQQIQNHLALGRVIITEMVLPANLVEYSSKVYDEPQGDVMGRQSFALIGYDKAKDRLLFQNSMGKDWGNDGQVWIPFDWYVRLVVDAFVLY